MAYAHRKTAAVEGETSALRTRIAEKAIVSAPAIAARPAWRASGPTTQSSQAPHNGSGRSVVRRRRRDVRECGVLVPRLCEVAEGDDAHRLVVFNDGEPAYIRLLHLLDRVLDRVV